MGKRIVQGKNLCANEGAVECTNVSADKDRKGKIKESKDMNATKGKSKVTEENILNPK